MFKLSMLDFKTWQHLIFPPACRICGDIFTAKPTSQQHITTECCAHCFKHIRIFDRHTCHRCGVPLAASLSPGPCGSCLQHAPAQQQTQSLYVYHGAVREALLAWKLQGQSAGLDWLLESAAKHLRTIFHPDDLLIPVPMPLPRMRRSGLHHSADLCLKIAALTGCATDWQILRRTGNHTRQSALQGKARQRNLRKAFSLANDYPNRLKAQQGKGQVWVIDDILTTGATLRHACQAMLPIKQDVFAFSLARVNHNQQE
ncbi:MAG: double zinc ribbon domain-containing protein [Mariprofundaceae bacterium]|nr:double zinc ribbon domain-containing protein [Mariprofundaceae bacterium]